MEKKYLENIEKSGQKTIRDQGAGRYLKDVFRSFQRDTLHMPCTALKEIIENISRHTAYTDVKKGC